MNLIDHLQIEGYEISKDQMFAKMRLSEFHSQPAGYVHGGALLAFAETIAGYASNKLIDDKCLAMGQTISANHMKSKPCKGYVVGRGVLRHKGRCSHVWGIEVVDEMEQVLSYITVTNAIICKSSKGDRKNSV